MLEQTEKLKEMNDSYHTMLDYEKVLRNVSIILNRLHSGGGQGGNVMASMHGGIQTPPDSEHGYKQSHSLNAEEEKINQPLIGGEMNVMITHIAGTIETDEKERLKKLLFRSTRGKALTYFYDIPQEQPEDNGPLPKQKSVYVVVF